jgi:hypothetical protein
MMTKNNVIDLAARITVKEPRRVHCLTMLVDDGSCGARHHPEPDSGWRGGVMNSGTSNDTEGEE